MSAVNIPVLNTSDIGFNETLQKRLAFDDATDANVGKAVDEIIAAVRARGDAAVVELTNQFDRVSVHSMRD